MEQYIRSIIRVENGPQMTKRLKRPRDPVQLGKLVGDILTGQIEDHAPEKIADGKDPAAVARGRLGGLRGGEVRAARLSVEDRSEIAKKAADARWKKTAKD